MALCLLIYFSMGCTHGHDAHAPVTDCFAVEASCGQCNFDMEGDGCDLAVRYKNKKYWVSGSHIDSHGDAHADDGLCSAIHPAEVCGKLLGDTLFAESFKLLK